jgi:hypothetical protein
MADTAINFTYNGPESIRMELRHVSGMGTGITLSATDIDRIIHQLAKFRMQMTPEIARKLPEGQHELGLVDPLWSLASHPAAEEKTFFVRHTGFGWQMFLLHSNEAKKLGHALLAGPPPGTSSPQGPTSLPH